MTAAGPAEKLYTPDILALAVALADYPLDDDLPYHGSARSSSCGSQLELALSVDRTGTIDRVGLRVSACAIGQASAAIFVRHVRGCDVPAVQSSLPLIEAWLQSMGRAEPWPGLDQISAARAYPARHGAILLPWRAAIAALSNTSLAS